MTNTQDDTPLGDRPAKNGPKADYDVGYRKPPVAHRFKHGNNANPSGRKKGARNRKVVVREVLFEPVTVREGSEIRQMPALEAVLKKVLSKALAGDNKAALTIIGIAQKEGILTPQQGRRRHVGKRPGDHRGRKEEAGGFSIGIPPLPSRGR